MVNHSLSTVSYSWRQTDCEVEIKVDPSSGSMVSGGSAYCEVVIGGDKGRRREEGTFSTELLCGVEHSDVLLVLPVEGYVQVNASLIVYYSCITATLVPRPFFMQAGDKPGSEAT